MLADILLIIASLAALLIASISDLKRREVPDYVSFGLIAAALGIRLLHSAVYNDWLYFIWGVGGFALMLGFGALVYYTKQWGGGDAKLLMGLGAAFATAPAYIANKLIFLEGIPFSFIIVMLMNLFIIGAIYGLFWSVMLFIRNRNAAWADFNSRLARLRHVQFSVFGLAVFVLIGSFFIATFYRPLLLSISAFIVVYFYLFIFVKSSETAGMLKRLSPDKLTEGEWVAEDVKINGKTICSQRDLGLEKWQIAAIKKARIKSVLIKEGIAFVPALFLGLLATLIWGNVFFYLIH